MAQLAAVDDARVRAVSMALGPYAWRTLTPEMVSRCALAAIDGPTATAGQPVARQDQRIEVLVAFLARCRWRSLTAIGLSRQLVTALDTWLHESQWLEIELRWPLDGGG